MDFPTHPVLSGYTGFLLRKVSAASFERFAAVTDRFGLHPMHFGMLTVLDTDGPISQHDLSRQLGVDPSTMVARMDLLERKRMVSRRRSSADRRAYEITLTDKGRTTLASLREAASEANERTFGVLTDRERTQLHELMIKLEQSIDAGDDRPEDS